MKAEEVVDLLRVRYAAPAYALLEQVGNSTGWAHNRQADVIVMGLWPSRGLEIIGIEVKVNRYDWMKELAKPDKAEPIARYCDRWLIAAPAGLVKLEELPVNWGLIEVTEKGKLRAAKEGVKLTPDPLDRGFLAAILRKASAATPTLEMRSEARRVAMADAEKDLQQRVEYRTASLQGELEDLRRRIEQFEETTGLPLEKVPRSLYGFASGKELGEAWVYLAGGGAKKIRQELETLKNGIRRLTAGAEVLSEVFGDEVAD